MQVKELKPNLNSKNTFNIYGRTHFTEVYCLIKTSRKGLNLDLMAKTDIEEN